MAMERKEELDKLHKVFQLLKELGLDASDEQKATLRKMEREYVIQEAANLLNQELKRLLKNLQNSFSCSIRKQEGEIIVERKRANEVSDSSTSTGTGRSLVRVTYPDGRVSCHRTVTDTLTEVVKYAGAQRVRDLKIIMMGENIISNRLFDNLKHRASQKDVGDGLYVNAYSGVNTKYEQMMTINLRLHLGLRLERVID